MRWIRKTNLFESSKNLEEWHSWFAWFPVSVDVDNVEAWIWLEKVQRKMNVTKYWWTDWNTIDWEYRALASKIF